jgi:predicted O-methyltransferase YrrM
MSAHEPKQSLAMRKEIVAGASGRVLEIGCGTGASFAHYPDGIQVVATEPDRHMLKRAEKNLRELGRTDRVGEAPADVPAHISRDLRPRTAGLAIRPDQHLLIAVAV